jgi:hypothetical protein
MCSREHSTRLAWITRLRDDYRCASNLCFSAVYMEMDMEQHLRAEAIRY